MNTLNSLIKYGTNKLSDIQIFQITELLLIGIIAQYFKCEFAHVPYRLQPLYLIFIPIGMYINYVTNFNGWVGGGDLVQFYIMHSSFFFKRKSLTQIYYEVRMNVLNRQKIKAN